MIRHKGELTRRVLIAALLLAFGAVSASAYTIVMRDGRRVEIPDKFTVTSSTLTYEVGSGLQVTIQLNTVNIAATERANGGAAGSFLLKANAPNPVVTALPQGRPNPDRSITNADLEGYRRARIQSEKEYEQQRKELGLPSREERRREIAEIENRTVEQVRKMREIDEAYWRDRATALRTELAAVQAQFDLARRRPDDISSTYSFDAFPTVFPFDSVGFSSGFGRFGFGRFRHSRFHDFPFAGFPPFPLNPILLGHGVHFGSRPFGRAVFTTPRAFRSRPFHRRPMNPRRH